MHLSLKFDYCDRHIAWIVSLNSQHIGLIHRDEGVWYWAQFLGGRLAPQLATEQILAIAEKMIALGNPG